MAVSDLKGLYDPAKSDTPCAAAARAGAGAASTRQHGVVARRQLRELGFGEEAIKTRLAEGRLHHVHEEVYAVGHRRLAVRAPWWAAILAYGPGAVLSHQSAAVLWDIRRKRRGPIHVTAPCGRQGLRRRKGIWIHRCKLTADDVTRRDGFPVTTLARTLFDLAEVAPFDQLKGAAEEAERLKLLRLRELEEVCERGRGRRALRPGPPPTAGPERGRSRPRGRRAVAG